MSWIFAAEAIHDLVAITEYLNDHSPAASIRLEAALFTALDDLAMWPEAGVAQPMYGEAIRMFVVDRCSVYYDARANPIEVLAIIHGAQDKEIFLSKRV